MDSNPEAAHPTRIEQLLTPLRVDPPQATLPFDSLSCFSLFYRTTKDGLKARFETKSRRKASRTSCCRLIDLANASFNELPVEELALSREPTSSLGVEWQGRENGSGTFFPHC